MSVGNYSLSTFVDNPAPRPCWGGGQGRSIQTTLYFAVLLFYRLIPVLKLQVTAFGVLLWISLAVGISDLLLQLGA